MINTCTKFEFNPSTSWGSYARHRHNLLHGARSTTDIKPWHKHTTGELKIVHFFFQKLLKSDGQFDLDGQGQGDKFRIHLRHICYR